MYFYKTEISGVFIIKPKKHGNHNGKWFDSYDKEEFNKLGIKNEFVLEKQYYYKYGNIIGLGFQNGKFAQAKLISVIQGQTLNIAVDLRKKSPTFGKHISALLNDQENNMLFIPRGFAHGYSIQSDTAILTIKTDNLRSIYHQKGIIYNDPDLKINWGIPDDKIIIANEILDWPTFKQWQQQSKKAR